VFGKRWLRATTRGKKFGSKSIQFGKKFGAKSIQFGKKFGAKSIQFGRKPVKLEREQIELQSRSIREPAKSKWKFWVKQQRRFWLWKCKQLQRRRCRIRPGRTEQWWG